MLCLLLAGFVWWRGEQTIHSLQSKIGQSESQQVAANQLIASQSARLKELDDQVAGYRDYVVGHTSQKVEPRFLTGMRLPIASMQPPYSWPAAMPGAGRAYRGGIHEGMDFAVARGTPVLAVGDGRIIRVDDGYREPSGAELAQLSTLTEQLHFTPEHILDTFRGRQVWIVLPGNVIVRYCHLQSVAVSLGQHVRAGQTIGSSGSSGTLDGAQHLHFEIRVGNTYLGSGKTYQQMVQDVQRFFSAGR